jgi:hypothetical protein
MRKRSAAGIVSLIAVITLIAVNTDVKVLKNIDDFHGVDFDYEDGNLRMKIGM